MSNFQRIFNPINYNFRWTEDGWYEWDAKAARKDALKARNTLAKQLRAEGKTVSVFTLKDQLVSKGGIGSGRPHIEEFVNSYGLNAR
jgi:hypothetical protein